MNEDEYSYLHTDPNAPTKPYTGDDPYVLERLKASKTSSKSGPSVNWLDKLSVSTGIKAQEMPSIGSKLPTFGDIGKAFGDADRQIGNVTGISVADIGSSLNKATSGLKSLNTDQVSGLIAQASKEVPQGASSLSDDLGLGKFGLSPSQLEKGGYLKPGTVDNLVSGAGKSTTDVLSNAAAWTGKDGIKNVNNLLKNESLQNSVQTNLWKTEYDDLLVKGAISGSEDPAKLGGMLSTASKFGTDTAANWAKGLLPGDLKKEVDKIAKGAQTAVNLVIQKVPPSALSSLVPPVAVGTTSRKDVDQALSALIGNPKIATPSFAPPSAEDLLGGDNTLSTLVTTANTGTGSLDSLKSTLPLSQSSGTAAVPVDSPFGNLVHTPSANDASLGELFASPVASTGDDVHTRARKKAAHQCGCREDQLVAAGKGFATTIWHCPDGLSPYTKMAQR